MKQYKKRVAIVISLVMLLIAIAPGVSFAGAPVQVPNTMKTETQAADIPDAATLVEAVQFSGFSYVYADSRIQLHIQISDGRITSLMGRLVCSGFTEDAKLVNASKKTTGWDGTSFWLKVAASAGQSVSWRLTDLQVVVNGQSISLPDKSSASVPVRQYDLPADYLKVEGPSAPASGDTISVTITGRGIGMNGYVQTQGLEVFSVSNSFSTEQAFVLLPQFGPSSVTYTCRVTAKAGAEAVFRATNISFALEEDDHVERDMILEPPERSWQAPVVEGIPDDAEVIREKVVFTVYPQSVLNGDVITPNKEAEVNGITASPAGGEWKVEPLPDQGISASSGGVTINASLLKAGTYTLTYTTRSGDKKSVQIVQPGPAPSASPSASAEPSSAPQPSGGADPAATAKPAPPIPSVAGYQSGQIGNTKASYVKVSGSSTMFYLNSADKMERVAVPYVKDSSGKRWYPMNHGGTALFPRLENDKITCYCVFQDGMEVPVVNVAAAPAPVITDGYQTGTVEGRTYYVKVSGSSMMFYLQNASGKMERVAVPYVKDSTGKRWYPVNHGGTALFPKLTNGKISYTTGSGETVLLAA